jgi:hypothetical protein
VQKCRNDEFDSKELLQSVQDYTSKWLTAGAEAVLSALARMAVKSKSPVNFKARAVGR